MKKLVLTLLVAAFSVPVMAQVAAPEQKVDISVYQGAGTSWEDISARQYREAEWKILWPFMLKDPLIKQFVDPTKKTEYKNTGEKLDEMTKAMACYENILSTGEWNEEAKTCFAEVFPNDTNHAWMSEFAEKAINEPVNKKVFYTDSEYMFGKTGALGIEVSDDACGNSEKRIMQLFLKLYSDYSDKITAGAEELDFAYLVATGLYNKMKYNCVPNAVDKKIGAYNTSAMSDLYAVVNYIMFSPDKTTKSLVQSTLRKLGLYEREIDFYIATTVNRDYPRSSSLFGSGNDTPINIDDLIDTNSSKQ